MNSCLQCPGNCSFFTLKCVILVQIFFHHMFIHLYSHDICMGSIIKYLVFIFWMQNGFDKKKNCSLESNEFKPKFYIDSKLRQNNLWELYIVESLSLGAIFRMLVRNTNKFRVLIMVPVHCQFTQGLSVHTDPTKKLDKIEKMGFRARAATIITCFLQLTQKESRKEPKTKTKREKRKINIIYEVCQE